ncbi:MAG: ribonuclease PH [Synergistaceae bacterium]|nr:ribonuclease PH [Candidatus Equadaptatus faecalis]
MKRIDGRAADELRRVKLERNCNMYAEGSCLIECGNTRVLCTASVEEKVPPFLRGMGQGWVTAEYSMLPRATKERNSREISKGRPNSRGTEIQRLIGRSLRAAVKLDELGEYTITIDCDVLQADGGTRTASVTGGFVALFDALRTMEREKKLVKIPLKEQIAAVSCGMVLGVPMLDLCYAEDSSAEVDSNFVITGHGDFVEIQGTGEGRVFSPDELHRLTELAGKGVSELQRLQREALELTEYEEKLFA